MIMIYDNDWSNETVFLIQFFMKIDMFYLKLKPVAVFDSFESKRLNAYLGMQMLVVSKLQFHSISIKITAPFKSISYCSFLLGSALSIMYLS